MREVTLKITGMSCATCAQTITKVLMKLDGVEKVEVNLASEKAVIHYNPDKIDLETIIQEIEKVGYGVIRDTREVVFNITGMTCATCVQTIEKVTKKIPGVLEATVNLNAERGRFVYDPTLVTSEEIRQAIENIGYTVTGIEEEEGTDTEREAREKHIAVMKKRLIVAAVIGAVVTLLTYGEYIGLPVDDPTLLPWVLWAEFFLATPVMYYSGKGMFAAAYRALTHKTLSMDVMYSMGVGSAYVASVFATIGLLPSDFVFYETAVLLMAFLLLGRLLEAIAKGRTSEAIKKLMGLQAKTAVVIRDGQEVEIPIKDVKVGDIVVIKPGEKVPVDGVVVDGESYVDESMITGEPIPNLKKKGDEVIGATINKNSVLKIEAKKVGKDTLLAQIIKLVEEAQSSRPPIQRLADRIITYFIPTVLVIATVSFTYWYFIADMPSVFAFVTLVSVLVIACPCAFGLATPTALTVGMGKGAESGILIKNGEALELARNVTIVIFDKTGTLTIGKPEVTDVVTFSKDEDEVLKIVASAEKGSEHPLADAVVRKAKEKALDIVDPEEFEAITGKGVKAKLNGSTILIGNRKLMEENGYKIEDHMEQEIQRLEKGAKTAIIVAVDGTIVGVIGIADMVKDTAIETINHLHKMGRKVAMITGDNRRTAEAIARQLKIDRVMAEVLPQDKANEVKRLQDEGEIVAFVGDGINDAPALAQAEVGIAIGSGTDIAIESGEIVLIKDDLRDVVAGIQLSAKTLGKIKQNLFWAMIYNTILIPVAAGVLYPFTGITFQPEWAGAAMAISSVSVVTNSLLLKRYHPEIKKKVVSKEVTPGVAPTPT
jgi:Cu+-exporting ATPase